MFEVRITLEALKPDEPSALDFAKSVASALTEANVRGTVEVWDLQGGKSVWQIVLRRDN